MFFVTCLFSGIITFYVLLEKFCALFICAYMNMVLSVQAEFEAKKSKEKLTNFEAENEVSLCHFLPNFEILN